VPHEMAEHAEREKYVKRRQHYNLRRCHGGPRRWRLFSKSTPNRKMR
jgi:hypothetical protein